MRKEVVLFSCLLNDWPGRFSGHTPSDIHTNWQVVRNNIIGCVETKRTSWIHKEITHIHRKWVAIFDSWIKDAKMRFSLGKANYVVCILSIHFFFVRIWDCWEVWLLQWWNYFFELCKEIGLQIHMLVVCFCGDFLLLI